MFVERGQEATITGRLKEVMGSLRSFDLYRKALTHLSKYLTAIMAGGPIRQLHLAGVGVDCVPPLPVRIHFKE